MRLTVNDPRVEKLRTICRTRGKSALVLTRAPNQSWLLGGRVQIGIAGESCVCTTVITDEDVVVLTNNIEGGRLAAEEFGSVPVIRTVPWADATSLKELLRETAGENPLWDTEVEAELLPLRTALLPQQQEEALKLCQRAAAVVTRSAFRIRPGMTEFEISGLLAGEAISEGLIPNVLFTPADEHICRWRHALSTENRLKKTVMLSMGAQKNGLYCSITRFVCFGSPEDDTMRAWQVAASVAAEMYSFTRPGVRFDELFQKIREAYERAGAPEQMAFHHQGGLGGFQTRELRIDADSRGCVQAGQLFVWNPSATGYKVEDMLLVGADGNRIMTVTPAFPYKSFEAGGNTWQIPQPLTL